MKYHVGKKTEKISCLTRKRRKRTVINVEQLEALEKSFKEEQWPSKTVKQKLARDVQMTEQFVSIWFQNKRARVKREEDLDRLQKFLKERKEKKADCTESENPVRIKPNPTDTKPIEVSNIETSEGGKRIAPSVIDDSGDSPQDFVLGINIRDQQCLKVCGSTTSNPNACGYPKDVPRISDITTGFTPAENSRSTLTQQQKTGKTLFQSIISMMAIAEGGIIPPSDPDFHSAVNDALYGILINKTHRLVYDKDTGLELIPFEPI